MNNKQLGTITMVLSPMLALAGLASTYFNKSWEQMPAALLGLAFLIGWLCAVMGMRRARATGHGKAVRYLYRGQLTLLALAMCQQLMDMSVGAVDFWFYHLADLAWPASMITMLVSGIIVVRAGIWQDWRRWVPLLCGLTLPTYFLLAAAGLPEVGGYFFEGYSTLMWALLGLAVRRSARRKSRLRNVLAAVY